MILLVLGIYFIVSLCKTLQICSVYGFIFKCIILDVYTEIADIVIFNFLSSHMFSFSIASATILTFCVIIVIGMLMCLCAC